MKILKKVLLILLIIIIIGALGMSSFIGKAVFDGYTNSAIREDTLENENIVKIEYDSLVSNYETKEIKIQSTKEDHFISAIHSIKEGNENIAIFVHGMRGTKKTLPEEMMFFLEEGFNIISIDQRNSGENIAKYNTFGYLESFDILDTINYVDEQINNSGKVLLYGESYGGISSIIAAGRDDSKIDYLVLDCPIGDAREMLLDILKDIEEEQGLPAFMEFTGNIYTRFILGFSFKDINGNNWIREVSIPTLILNSKIDTVTPFSMGEELYKSITHNKKELVSSETANHARILQEDKEVYINGIRKFLNKY